MTLYNIYNTFGLCPNTFTAFSLNGSSIGLSFVKAERSDIPVFVRVD